MNKVGDLHKYHKQLSGPILGENTPQDRSLWHLSLVLMEIAEQQACVIKTEPLLKSYPKSSNRQGRLSKEH
jgi:hypothetical protein